MNGRERMSTFLPECLIPAHNLCFLNHDVLVELLQAGEAVGSFVQTFEFRDDADHQAFQSAADVFEWLDKTKREGERVALLRRTVFPAVLSDFLHFVYEALEASRKAKLNVTYALLRKPLQESLFLLEIIAADVDKFATHLAQNPLLLWSQGAGGLEAHTRRITEVLRVLQEEDRFVGAYIAQLRYDKRAEDGFDGLCNLAMHLFTRHEAIRTEPLNINFVFSGGEEKLSQWYYLYSRLPYLLFYARRLVEHVYATFEQTDPVYLADIERRIAAGTILWGPTLAEDYRHATIDRFVESTRLRLVGECKSNGYRDPGIKDLIRMHDSGAWPGESRVRVWARLARYWVATLPRRVARSHPHRPDR